MITTEFLEEVAKEACNDCISFIQSYKTVEHHLADQLVPLMALAKGYSCFTTSKITLHLLTNIQVAEQFLPIKFSVSGEKDHPGEVSVDGIGFGI